MKIERLPLLEALETVKPALASKDLIEQLAHVWFDGKRVMAYNDANIGIQAKLKTPFKGGIRGSLLLGLLHNSRAKEITLEDAGEGVMNLKAARTTAKLSVLGEEQSVWKFPSPSPKKAVKFTEHFVEHLKRAMISIGKDTSTPETLGVTVMSNGGGRIRMYCTDNNTFSVVDTPAIKGAPSKFRHIIPKEFCEQLIKLFPDGGQMEFRQDCILSWDEESGVELYGRLIHTSKPLNFDDMLSRHSKGSKNKKFEIPERLTMALDRMAVLFEGLNSETVEFNLDNGWMKLYASIEGRGELKDSIKIPETIPPVKFRAEPALIRRGLDMSDEMMCSDDVVRLSHGNDSFVYLVSNAVA